MTRYVDEGRIALEHDRASPARRPSVDVVERGYQFLSDSRLDGAGADCSRRSATALWDVGLPPRSIEDEWGPGQFEFTFSPMEGLDAADAMILFRSAMKAGLRAPRAAGVVHVLARAAELLPVRLAPAPVAASTARRRERVRRRPRGACRRSALQFVAGLLDHAQAMTVFGDPTINGYKRFRPYSFAPDRIGWAVDNRGALVRIQGGPGDAQHATSRTG